MSRSVTWEDEEPTAFAFTEDGQSEELDDLARRLEVATAQRDSLARHLRILLEQMRKIGSYTTPEQQTERAWAQAALAEVEGSR